MEEPKSCRMERYQSHSGHSGSRRGCDSRGSEVKRVWTRERRTDSDLNADELLVVLQRDVIRDRLSAVMKSRVEAWIDVRPMARSGDNRAENLGAGRHRSHGCLAPSSGERSVGR